METASSHQVSNHNPLLQVRPVTELVTNINAHLFICGLVAQWLRLLNKFMMFLSSMIKLSLCPHRL